LLPQRFHDFITEQWFYFQPHQTREPFGGLRQDGLRRQLVGRELPLDIWQESIRRLLDVIEAAYRVIADQAAARRIAGTDDCAAHPRGNNAIADWILTYTCS
jgi:hypothetical protein